MRDTAEIIQRHLAFWQRGPSDQPLGSCWIGSRIPAETYHAARTLPIGRVNPQHIDMAAFRADYDRLHDMHESVGDDAFWAAAAYYAIPWNEAILGCPVYYSGESFWVEPVSRSRLESLDFPGPGGDAWLGKLLEFTADLVRLADGRYPVTPTLMRGSSDMAAALRGHVEMVYDMYDHPEESQHLLEKLTDFWIDIARRQLALIPPFETGYVCNFYGIWAPDHVVCLQEDTASSLSPMLFQRYLLSGEQQITAAFPYTVMHIHSPSIWIVDQLLAVESLSAIEINYDDNGPHLPELLHWLRRIQEEKPLVIRGAFAAEEIAYIKRELSPKGLALNMVAHSVAEAKSLIAGLRED